MIVPVEKFSIKVHDGLVGRVEPDWLHPPIQISPEAESAPVAADMDVPVPPFPAGVLSTRHAPGIPMTVTRIFWEALIETVMVSLVVRPLLFMA
jgi:hypothetical protein